MTPEHIELHRKRFEDLSKLNERMLAKDSNGNYEFEITRNMFSGYLLFAGNNTVSLPDDDCFEYSDSGISILDRGIRRETVISSLESQGIKIKSSGSE